MVVFPAELRATPFAGKPFAACWVKYSLLAVLLSFVLSGHAVVEFPGTTPGRAESTTVGNTFTLENAVIAESWQFSNGKFGPRQIVSKLTGQTFEQTGTELFRAALTAPVTHQGVAVAVRLEAGRVVALASRDGDTWTELTAFPRSAFQGKPKLVRIGKMNLQAQAKDFRGDSGPLGECAIKDFNLAGALKTPPEYVFNVAAHQAATHDFIFPSGTDFVSCRIDKETDQGMSWGPALALVWDEGKQFILIGVRDSKPVFNVTTVNGEQIIEGKLADYPLLDLPATAFTLAAAPKFTRLTPMMTGGPVAARSGGMALEADLTSDRGVRAHWRAELRDGSSYIRETVEFSTLKKSIPLYGVELLDVKIPGLRTIGSVPGCPAAGSGMFFGVEMPGAENSLTVSGAHIGLACKLELTPAQAYSFSAVTGVEPEGQLRRSFLYYVERERARPSSPFLHYNCWYDLGFSADADKLVEVARQFDTELVKKRGVRVQSYLVDDGWDDPDRGLWMENTNKFPGGFAALKARMDPLNAHLAIWISPMGGYGGAEDRTADAQKMGIIPAGAQLDLSYPGYKQWFQDRCLQLMREDGVNAFKWDRAGDGVGPHFMALLDIARNLRKQNPDVFINVTVGTWPSPFWLNHVDSTWRNGSADVGWAGKGDDREKWITFRDGECRKLFVEKSPLYPLNSIMAHGIVNGRQFQGERVGKTGPHLKNEARSYFAIGSSLQELYLTPSLMTAEAWDNVAKAAKWGQANANVLVDSHWVGGDPLQLEAYGYAAWIPGKGTLMIRNPDDQPQTIELDAETVFELPANAPQDYALTSPYPDQRVQTLRLEAGQSQAVTLGPFEVLVFDARPTD